MRLFTQMMSIAHIFSAINNQNQTRTLENSNVTFKSNDFESYRQLLSGMVQIPSCGFIRVSGISSRHNRIYTIRISVWEVTNGPSVYFVRCVDQSETTIINLI